MKCMSAVVVAAGVAVGSLALVPEAVEAQAGQCSTAFGPAHTNNSRWSWTTVEIDNGGVGDPYQAGASGNVFVLMGTETWCVPVNPGNQLNWDVEEAHQPRLLSTEGDDEVKICQNSNIGSDRYSTITEEGIELGYEQGVCTEITGYDAHPEA